MKYAVIAVLLLAGSCGPGPGPSPAAVARESARRHSARSLQILDLVGQRIDDFFAHRRPGVEAFCNELFSLKGKWRALFWSREDFETHVRRRFEENVFRPEDFERDVVEPVRQDLIFAMDASEAGLAGDLNQWARGTRPSTLPPDVRPALTRLVSGLVVQDLGLNVASIVGSEVAVLASSAILTRMGAFGAPLAAGAGTSWATFGIGLVIGTVAAVAIDAAVGDELEETARESVRIELDMLRARMLESEDGLWRAARRALESHGRALEKSAAQLLEGPRHGANGA
jgi:hypothetical protein